MFRISYVITMATLLCGCSVLQTSVPLGTQPGAPVATATSLRLWYDSALTVSSPSGIGITYGSKADQNAALGSAWTKGILDSLTLLANSAVAQALSQGYAAGGGLPALPAVGLPTGVNASALQSALQAAGCPLADKLPPAAFASLLSALAGSGVALNVESLLPILGGGGAK